MDAMYSVSPLSEGPSMRINCFISDYFERKIDIEKDLSQVSHLHKHLYPHHKHIHT